ncbi:RHS repeat-associated core domain-containing protein [Pseudomonas silesiensis]|uniref:RHS repeat domain-containing protein n=1 Tax=Pseudomonas silesiensis TaxID=1853130 RepID=UPI0030CFB953
MQPCALTTHSHTPKLTVVEPRGLTVRSVDYYRANPGDTAEERVNRTAHDPAGWAIAQWDPRLFLDASAPANLHSIHSQSGAILASTSVDAGLRISLLGEAGQLVHLWDGRGSQRQMHYDDQSRLNAIFEQAVEGEAVCAERLSYAASDQAFADRNQCGRLIRHDDPAGALLFNDYGLTGAVLEQVRCMANERTAGYATLSRVNPLGELLSRTDARGNEQRFSQTLDGLLHAVDLHLNNSVEHLPMVNAITYNAHGQVEKEVAGNGVVTTLEYAAEDGRLKRLLSRLAQSDPLQDLRYLYDPVGNVSSIEDAALPIRYFANQRIEPVSHYRYDTLYRLIEATGWEAGAVKHGPSSAASADPAMPGNYRQTYRYDDGNNLLELTHVGPQNPGHRLVAAAHSNRCLPVRDGIEPDEEDFRSGFDANGNLLKLQPGQTLSWDVRNQLREVRPVERDSGLDDYELYFYGADGMRVRKVRSLQTNAQTVVAQTLYLPGLEIRTHSGTGEELHVIEVATGRGSVRVLHWEKQRPTDITNNQQRYSLTDHLGSSTLELDQDARIITQERYYPFGGTAWSNGEAVQVSYKTVRYSGKERDTTGLYYYGFRYYVPWALRWLNPDPAGPIDGLNYYRMVRNNPLAYTDNSGLSPEVKIVLPSVIDSKTVVENTEEGGLNNESDGRVEETFSMFSWLDASVSLVNRFFRPLINVLWRQNYQKFVTLDYPDFTIKQFELHSPSSPKELMIQGHGRLRSPVHGIWKASTVLNFYTPLNTELSASPNDLYRFQARAVDVAPSEVIDKGAESRDYEVAFSDTENSLSAFVYNSQLLNSKPAINTSSDLARSNFHDVLTVKPGRSISLGNMLKQIPDYSRVHCFFCRTRNPNGQFHDPFSSDS